MAAKTTKRKKSGVGKKTVVRVLKSRVTYRAPVFYVTSEIVKEPTGVTARRDIIHHPGSVVVVAVDGSGKKPKVLLERQYRYAAGKYMWELPAGRIDEGETALEGAKRELIEETGYRARRWKQALHYYASPGFLDETMTIFLAEDLEKGTATPEDDEVIRTRMFPLSAVVKMIMSGRIEDGKTISGVLWFARAWHGA